MLMTIKDTLHDTVFFTKEIWFYIFGGLILLYGIASLYNRMKRPKDKITSINAKVISVNKARVQTNHRDAGFDGLMSGSAIPAAHFDVTFVDVDNEMLYIFSVSERISEKFMIGQVGLLCFKGDDFISFGEKEEQNKEEKKYILKKKILPKMIIGGCILALGLGVWEYFSYKNEEQVYNLQEIENRPLTIYLSSQMSQHGDKISNGSQYNLGEFNGLSEKWGVTYHVYFDAIENYKKETGREVQFEFFNVPSEMMQRAYEEWKKGVGPDVIICDYANNGVLLYPYMAEGMFEDMGGHFEEDEIYSSGEYITRILEGGKVGDQQFVFPLTFNMNMIYTSEERMKEHGIWLSEGMSYDELLALFQNEWDSVRNEEEYLMVQMTNKYKNRFPVLVFQSASGIELIDYETGKIQLEYDDFSEWASLYESYICDEYQMNREELKEEVIQNPQSGFPINNSRFNTLVSISEVSVSEVYGLTQKNVFCWVEGGSWAGYSHSFAANTGYYESRMSEDEETFIPLAIPSKQSSDEYVAEITSFGVILSGSKKADEGYQFIKTLADHEHFIHYDLSVNRQAMENTLEELGKTKYALNIALGQLPPPDEAENENAVTEGEDEFDWYYDVIDYEIQPLSEESKQYLLNMVDHIGVAGLMEGQLDVVVIDEIGRYIWGDVDTIEDAYDNTIQRMVEMGYIK